MLQHQSPNITTEIGGKKKKNFAETQVYQRYTSYL